MKRNIATLITCSSLLFLPGLLVPGLLDARPAHKKDFSIAHETPTLKVGFNETHISDDNSLFIVLSDGSQWNVKKDAHESVLFTISKEWKKGDDIRIDKTDKNPFAQFLLKNARTNHVYFVDLAKNLKPDAESVTISQIDRNGYALVTNDGKIWSIGWVGSFNSSKWKVGDAILINKSSHSHFEDYELINMRDQKTVWASVLN